jgi:hypothetical protein
MTTPLDGSVYPDVDPPDELVTMEQKADYLHRIVGAFDFGIPPDRSTIRLLAGWREVFDQHPLPGSPGYHALRRYFGWPEVERTTFFVEPAYRKLDALEGREDGFEDQM